MPSGRPQWAASAGIYRASEGRLASAVIYSIIMSCRRRGINPQDYLTDVLRRLPTAKTSDIQDLVPANWKAPTLQSS
jgi:hypothetical protein